MSIIRAIKNSLARRKRIEENRANVRCILDRYYYSGYSGGYLKYGNTKAINFKKFVYLFKTALIYGFDTVLVIPSRFLGTTAYYNMLGITLKTKGKLEGAFFARPMNYYEKVSGK